MPGIVQSLAAAGQIRLPPGGHDQQARSRVRRFEQQQVDSLFELKGFF
jgi:hypothetical protein